MPTPNRVPSAQQEQVPESASPTARRDATAELGAEGGSYGDLTQSERARREWEATTEHSSWLRAPAALVVFIVFVAVILAVAFWAMAGG